MAKLLGKRRERQREPQPEQGADETATKIRLPRAWARVALIILAGHTTYVFQTTSRSGQLRALLEASKDALNKISLDLLPQEAPAWTRALEEESPITATNTSGNNRREISRGILSNKPLSFFQEIRDKIDQADLKERCERYGYPLTKEDANSNSDNSNNSNSTTTPRRRRIFYGSLIASESWETLDIVATEAYQIFEGVVFVESNRTQMFNPRTVRFDSTQEARLKALFGANQLQVVQWVNENQRLLGLEREQVQRNEIHRVWKEMGMTPDDIGYIGDVDETFSRDFLRAVQSCYVKALDYETHHCHIHKAKLLGFTRVFETSPECMAKGRGWYHPDMVVGACVEGIGNEERNPIAPRRGTDRRPGFGSCSRGVENITDDRHPLYSAADIRSLCGGQYQLLKAPNHERYTAFHVHNHFVDFASLRFKYQTYGHPVKDAMTKPLEEIHDDMKLMIRCIRNETDAPNNHTYEDSQHDVREPGGVDGALPPFPIYFHDKDYRQRKHRAIQIQVEEDEQRRREKLQLTPLERKIEDVTMQSREAQRLKWAKEKELANLRKRQFEGKDS